MGTSVSFIILAVIKWFFNLCQFSSQSYIYAHNAKSSRNFVSYYYWLPALKFGSAVCLSSAKLLGNFFFPPLTTVGISEHFYFFIAEVKK